jgi:hypothetical protein
MVSDGDMFNDLPKCASCGQCNKALTTVAALHCTAMQCNAMQCTAMHCNALHGGMTTPKARARLKFTTIRVTRLGNLSPIWLLLEAHYNILKR